MLIVLIRSCIIYMLVFLVIRIMGKRELAQMQPYELIIIVMIADLAASPLSSNNIPLINGISSIVALLLAYIIFTFLIQSNNKVQYIMCGKPSIIIENGKIVEEELRTQQYTIEELMSQLRKDNIYKVTDVAFAILETSGDLNVVKKEDNMKQLPYTVISDGKICTENLKMLKIEEEYINNILKDKKLNAKDILLGVIDEDNQFIYQIKEK